MGIPTCKDCHDTGYYTFGASCKFMHIRDDVLGSTRSSDWTHSKSCRYPERPSPNRRKVAQFAAAHSQTQSSPSADTGFAAPAQSPGTARTTFVQSVPSIQTASSTRHKRRKRVVGDLEVMLSGEAQLRPEIYKFGRRIDRLEKVFFCSTIASIVEVKYFLLSGSFSPHFF
jgi:hypothetical protein